MKKKFWIIPAVCSFVGIGAISAATTISSLQKQITSSTTNLQSTRLSPEPRAKSTSWKLNNGQEINVKDNSGSAPLGWEELANLYPTQVTAEKIREWVVYRKWHIFYNPASDITTQHVYATNISADNITGKVNVSIKVTRGYNNSDSPVDMQMDYRHIVLKGFKTVSQEQAKKETSWKLNNGQEIDIKSSSLGWEGFNELYPTQVNTTHIKNWILAAKWNIFYNPISDLAADNISVSNLKADNLTGKVTATININKGWLQGAISPISLSNRTITLTNFKTLTQEEINKNTSWKLTNGQEIDINDTSTDSSLGWNGFQNMLASQVNETKVKEWVLDRKWHLFYNPYGSITADNVIVKNLTTNENAGTVSVTINVNKIFVAGIVNDASLTDCAIILKGFRKPQEPSPQPTYTPTGFNSSINANVLGINNQTVKQALQTINEQFIINKKSHFFTGELKDINQTNDILNLRKTEASPTSITLTFDLANGSWYVQNGLGTGTKACSITINGFTLPTYNPTIINQNIQASQLNLNTLTAEQAKSSFDKQYIITNKNIFFGGDVSAIDNVSDITSLQVSVSNNDINLQFTLAAGSWYEQHNVGNVPKNCNITISGFKTPTPPKPDTHQSTNIKPNVEASIFSLNNNTANDSVSKIDNNLIYQQKNQIFIGENKLTSASQITVVSKNVNGDKKSIKVVIELAANSWYDENGLLASKTKQFTFNIVNFKAEPTPTPPPNPQPTPPNQGESPPPSSPSVSNGDDGNWVWGIVGSACGALFLIVLIVCAFIARKNPTSIDDWEYIPNPEYDCFISKKR